MGVYEFWEKYMTAGEAGLARLGEDVFDGEYDIMIGRLHAQLLSHKMYVLLEEQTIIDMERFRDRLEFFEELNRFYKKEFLDKGEERGSY